MKKLLVAIFCASGCITADAQLMFIHKTNHSVESIYTSDIDSIVFNSDTTTCPIAVDIEGNKYKTVKIGNQCWMAENLKTTKDPDGYPLTDGAFAGNISGNPVAEYYWIFDNMPSYVPIYGLLYTWNAVMDSAASSNSVPSGVQGVCPAGWHLPSIAEWDTLATYINDDNGGNYLQTPNANNGFDWDSIGGHLKSNLLWGINWPHGDGLDSYGFNARPAGYRGSLGNDDDCHDHANFWSSTQQSVPNHHGYQVLLHSTDGKYIKMSYPQNSGFSVRCVKD
jgi:uncharacterized protein (TIGR02145 family)